MKRLRRGLILFFLSASLGFGAEFNGSKSRVILKTDPAQENIPLTLDDCFKAALKRSEVLATQQELVFQAEENYRQARGRMMPSINGGYSYSHSNPSGLGGSSSTTPSAGQQPFLLTADQPLFRGFRDFAAIHGAKAAIKAQEQALEWAGMQLYADVAQGFYGRLAVQKDLHVLDKELEQYQNRIKELQDRVAIGRSKITEVLTIQAARAILKAQREQITGQLDVAKDVLAFLTDMNPDLPLADSEAVPTDPGSLKVYQSRVDARPDVMAAKRNVEVFDSNVSVAKGARLPSVDLLGNYARRPDLRRTGAWELQIAMTLPLFEGGIISSNVRVAHSQKRQSEIQLSKVQRLALEEISSLHHNFMADLAQLKALQEAFNISEQNYEANLKDYELGLVTNLDVLQALTAYQDTERSLEKIRYLVKIDKDRLEASAANRLSLVKGLDHS